ncbi:hypothetical protein S40288_11671 [Stachybotrys chartarum IBT 40288]|nr:hypothetical protein S40288_11671 [Stachybotrys chartarum IBT 40288]
MVSTSLNSDLDLDEVLKLLSEDDAKKIRSLREALQSLSEGARKLRFSASYEIVFQQHLDQRSGREWNQFRQISKNGHDRLVACEAVARSWGQELVTHYGFLSKSRTYCNTLRSVALALKNDWPTACEFLNRCIYLRARDKDKRKQVLKQEDMVNPIVQRDLIELDNRLKNKSLKKGEHPCDAVEIPKGLTGDKYGLLWHAIPLTTANVLPGSGCKYDLVSAIESAYISRDRERSYTFPVNLPEFIRGWGARGHLLRNCILTFILAFAATPAFIHRDCGCALASILTPAIALVVFMLTEHSIRNRKLAFVVVYAMPARPERANGDDGVVHLTTSIGPRSAEPQAEFNVSHRGDNTRCSGSLDTVEGTPRDFQDEDDFNGHLDHGNRILNDSTAPISKETIAPTERACRMKPANMAGSTAASVVIAESHSPSPEGSPSTNISLTVEMEQISCREFSRAAQGTSGRLLNAQAGQAGLDVSEPEEILHQETSRNSSDASSLAIPTPHIVTQLPGHLQETLPSSRGHRTPQDGRGRDIDERQGSLALYELHPPQAQPAQIANYISRACKISPDPDRLEEDVQALYRLLLYIGTKFPMAFLLDACQPKVWGQDGTVQRLALTSLGCYASAERWGIAMQVLLGAKALWSESIHGHVFFSVDSSFRLDSPLGRDEQSTALIAILCAFPKGSYLEPIHFTLKGMTMIPILEKLLTSLWQQDLPLDILELAFETLLSASYFSTYDWKKKAISAAKRVAAMLDSQLHKLRVVSREASLSRLYESVVLPPIPSITFPASDARSNAWAGQFVLTEMQRLIDVSAPTELVRTTFDRFIPLLKHRPSDQEQVVILKGKFLVAKSLRFEGNFEEAEQCLHELLFAANKSRISWKVSPHFAEIRSERGFYESAIEMLLSDIAEYSKFQPLKCTTGTRLLIALANAYLLGLLWTWMRERQSPGKDSVKEVIQRFQLLEVDCMTSQGFMAKHNLFVVRSGVAIVHHIAGNFQEADAAWKSAQQAAEALCKKPGYAAMIVLYSRSQIAYHLQSEEAQSLNDEAKRLWQEVGRQFYFTGLGTIWPEILGDIEEEKGRERIIPELNDQPSLCYRESKKRWERAAIPVEATRPTEPYNH